MFADLDGLFEKFASESPIFLRPDVLQHDFIPDDLPHRESEILLFGTILAPSLRNSKCSNIFAYGKTGTGKTAVCRCALNKLETKGKELGRNVYTCYVNCRTEGTEYRVLANLCLKIGVQVPFTGLATAEVLKRFRACLSRLQSPFVVVLDEIDTLIRNCGDGLLYVLTRINEDMVNSRLSIVGITNDIYFKEMLDARVLSSLSEEEVVFKPYTAEQIKDILVQRAPLAFHAGALPESTLNLCAALSAAEHGDARRALDLIRISGEMAERKGDTFVGEEHVREAVRKIEHDRVFEAISSLPLQSKMILYVLSLCGIESNITTGNLYAAYLDLCRKINIEPLTQRRVSGLLSELCTLGVISAQLANLGRYGRTKRIKVNISPSLLGKVFLGDPRLNKLVTPPVTV